MAMKRYHIALPNPFAMLRCYIYEDLAGARYMGLSEIEPVFVTGRFGKSLSNKHALEKYRVNGRPFTMHLTGWEDEPEAVHLSEIRDCILSGVFCSHSTHFRPDGRSKCFCGLNPQTANKVYDVLFSSGPIPGTKVEHAPTRRGKKALTSDKARVSVMDDDNDDDDLVIVSSSVQLRRRIEPAPALPPSRDDDIVFEMVPIDKQSDTAVDKGTKRVDRADDGDDANDYANKRHAVDKEAENMPVAVPVPDNDDNDDSVRNGVASVIEEAAPMDIASFGRTIGEDFAKRMQESVMQMHRAAQQELNRRIVPSIAARREQIQAEILAEEGGELRAQIKANIYGVEGDELRRQVQAKILAEEGDAIRKHIKAEILAEKGDEIREAAIREASAHGDVRRDALKMLYADETFRMSMTNAILRDKNHSTNARQMLFAHESFRAEFRAEALKDERWLLEFSRQDKTIRDAAILLIAKEERKKNRQVDDNAAAAIGKDLAASIVDGDSNWRLDGHYRGKLSNGGRTFHKTAPDGWDCNLLGTTGWDRGIHEWFIELEAGTCVSFGIAHGDVSKDNADENRYKRYDLFCAHGAAVDITDASRFCFPGCSEILSGETISIRLDLDQHTLTYGLNGVVNAEPTFTGLEAGIKWYPYFAVSEQGCKFTVFPVPEMIHVTK